MLRLIWVHLLFLSLLAFKELVKLLGVNELPNLAPENLFLDKKNNNMQTDEQLSIGIQRILLYDTAITVFRRARSTIGVCSYNGTPTCLFYDRDT